MSRLANRKHSTQRKDLAPISSPRRNSRNKKKELISFDDVLPPLFGRDRLELATVPLVSNRDAGA